MGTYTKTLTEVFSVKNQTWERALTQGMFPVKPGYEPQFGGETTDSPFQYQSYAIAAFIAGVRNDYKLTPLAENSGLPRDHKSVESHEGWGGPEMVTRYPEHMTENCSNAWVLLKDLLDFDYQQCFEDRRKGRNAVPVGEGVITSYKEHLGDFYFEELEVLQKIGKPEHVRIVFAFD
jgi:hypothetical protein